MEDMLRTIEKKLGFDPFNPPHNKLDGWAVDDHTPRVWASLSYEEKVYLYKALYGKCPFA